MRFLTSVLVGAAVGLAGATEARAQVVAYYQPVTSYYAPVAPLRYMVAAPVVVSAPVARVSYYAPIAPAPTTCCAPVAAAPVPAVTYYRAPQVAYQPTAQVVTRYRPILGGTVSRVRYGYTPVVY